MEWWQMKLDQKHYFKENPSFPCPSNATATQVYLGTRFFHGGLERMISPREAIELHIQPGV
jgi:hypothetical protein